MDQDVSVVRMPARAGLAVATASLLVVLVVLVLLLTGSGTPSVGSRVQDVAGRLRCPTCAAESVADSQTPLARSMRQEIRRQIEAGRSPDQVVAWFRARYGDRAVLTPPAQGVGWLLWTGPFIAVVAGLLTLVLVARRRADDPRTATPSARMLSPARLAAVGLVVACAGAGVPLVLAHRPSQEAASAQPAAASGIPNTGAGGGNTPTAARRLDARQQYDAAVAVWRAALRDRPGSAVIRTRLAFDLVRTGHAAGAQRIVRPALGTQGPYRSLALLVLGLAQRQLGRPEAVRTLRVFLHRYPEHPAAAQVRRLLEEAGTR